MCVCVSGYSVDINSNNMIFIPFVGYFYPLLLHPYEKKKNKNLASSNFYTHYYSYHKNSGDITAIYSSFFFTFPYNYFMSLSFYRQFDPSHLYHDLFYCRKCKIGIHFGNLKKIEGEVRRKSRVNTNLGTVMTYISQKICLKLLLKILQEVKKNEKYQI